jgi:hypothetical protein
MENAQCINNIITTIVAILRQEQAKSVTQPDYLVAKFKYNAENDSYTCPQGETLKLQEDGIKVGAQNKGGYQFKNTEPQPAKMSVKHLCTARPAGEIDQTVCASVEKITNAIKKTRNYTERDKR